ncbi:hypothetical protein FA13DRAFT_1802580 [Coprinellus micaceus]|uniref:Uncharacterized protein n=1 Tax=Coprinellus micaceus TaxID=71717 RepID=A0A4Y7SBX3_COPMI|nr:hypothetical protein FA13DRAFT_1802580 [Coprinellus micaceus]
MSEVSSPRLAARPPTSGRYLLRRTMREMAPVTVFQSMTAKQGFEAALRAIAKHRARAVLEGNQVVITWLDQQTFEVEQWQVGVNALNSEGYRVLRETAISGDFQALVDAANEIFYGGYDPEAGSPEDSDKAPPKLTLRWFVESVREWVVSCEETLSEVGMSPTTWLSSATAFEVNRTTRRGNHLTLPPDYDEAVRAGLELHTRETASHLSPVREEEEGVANDASTQVRSQPPQVRVSQSRSTGEQSMSTLMYQVTRQAGGSDGGSTEAAQPSVAGQEVALARRGILETVVNGLKLGRMINSMRGTSSSGSGASPRGRPDLAVAFGGPLSAPASSSSSRARSPAVRTTGGNSPYNSPSPGPGRPIPLAGTASPLANANSPLQASSSSSSTQQLHADLYHRVTSKKMWTERLSPHLCNEPQQRQFRLQGTNPVPLVFDAVDGSGDTVAIDLHVGNIVLNSAAPRTIIPGGLSELVTIVARFAGSVFSQRF